MNTRQDQSKLPMHHFEWMTAAKRRKRTRGVPARYFSTEAKKAAEGDAFPSSMAAFCSFRRKRSAGMPESFMDSAG
jgi:hypothetical protein